MTQSRTSEAAVEDVRAEIRALEKQIRDLKRGSTTASKFPNLEEDLLPNLRRETIFHSSE